MSDEESNVNTDLFKNIERLRQLRIEHRDLDDIISRLTMDFKVDEVQMKRLKRRARQARTSEPAQESSPTFAT